MRIANCEQSCCLSQHSALRGRVCWQRRCYSVCKAVIPLLRSVLTSRVSSGAPGVQQAPGLCIAEPPQWGFRPGQGLVLGNLQSPPRGSAASTRDMRPAALCPAKGTRTASHPREKNPFPFVHLLCQHRARDLPKTHSLCSLWGNDQALALALFSLTPDYNLFLAHS